MGDGALAEFPSTEAAVRAAHVLLAAFQGAQGTAFPGALRIGVHVGDVATTSDGDLYGDGVNIAARLQAEAQSGQVLVSEDVWRQLRARRELRFEPLGDRTLKGISAPVGIYAVQVAEDSAWAEYDVAAPDAAPEAPAAPAPRMSDSGLTSRLRPARLLRVLALYLAGAAIVFLGTTAIGDAIGLPGWISMAALVLLAIGLGVVVATAWVQARVGSADRAEPAEVPGKWDLALGQLGRSVTRGELPHLTWSRAIFGGAVAFLLLFGFAGLYVVIQDRGRSFSPPEAIAEDAAPGIAVLPFTTSGPGLDVWREGVIGLVSTNIDGAAGLRAIDSRTVLARWRENVEGTATPDLETALEVARRTGARYALLGDAVALGSDIRLSAEVYDLQTSRSLGQAQVEGAPDSVYALVDRLSIGVLQKVLGSEGGTLPQVDLARSTTTSLPALKAFLEGEVLYRRSDFKGAIPAFGRAVDADSTFAMALYHLSQSHAWSEDISSALLAEYGERAARFADRLPEREATLLTATDALNKGTLDGLKSLRDAVRKYPDDPELWYVLGDTYFHLGPMDLIPDEEAERAFEQSVTLDPNFSPGYIHLLDFAFHRGDRTRAEELLETYGRLTGDTPTHRTYRLAYDLAWGDPAARTRARAALDTADVGRIAITLFAPPSLSLASEAYTIAFRRSDATPGRVTRHFEADFNRGKISAALATLEDPRLGDFSPALLYRVHRHGLIVPAARLDAGLSFDAADTLAVMRPFYAAAYAAEQGRRSDYDRAVARIRADAVRLGAAGDSSGMRFSNGMVRALDGFVAWREGKPEEASTLLEVARRSTVGLGWKHELVNNTIRRWIAQIYEEMDRPREAAAVWASLFGVQRLDPFAACSLGRVYAELGEREKARQAYETCLLAWRDADPVLEPRVAEARRALARL